MTYQIEDQGQCATVIYTYTPDPISMDDHPEPETVRSEYEIRGSYVYRVGPNGSAFQICEGLKSVGPTLMPHRGESCADAIRRTLNL